MKMKRGVKEEGGDVKPTDAKDSLEQLINLYILRIFMSDPLQVPGIDNFHDLVRIQHRARIKRTNVISIWITRAQVLSQG